MKAIAVTPMKSDSLRLLDLSVPVPGKRELLLEVQRIGICGTDRDIISGRYGEAPKGSDYLVVGHESLSRVEKAGRGVEGFRKGDLVVPTVRRNCWENCLNCKGGESDMCLTGDYKEHGIKGLHGFASEFAVTDSSFVVKLPESLSELGVLLEPMSVVEKGLVQIYEIQNRMKWEPKEALVLGSGPVGLLATAILKLGGLDVKTLATRSRNSLKARLVESTGSKYINANETPIESLDHKFDIVFEITGNPTVALEAQDLIRVNGVACFIGLYRNQQGAGIDIGKSFTDLVLGNKLHFGSVNANRSYFEKGAKDLVKIRKKWPGLLEKIITRKAKPEDLGKAYRPESQEEIKTIIEFKR